MIRPTHLLLALLLPLLLAACGGRTAEPVGTPPGPAATATLARPAPTLPPAPTVVPTLPLPPAATPANTPVAASTPAAAPTAETIDWADYESRSADGHYQRGNPDAAILILDYSDFL